MNNSSIAGLILAAAAGVCLGLVCFGGLWLTISRFTEVRSPAAWFLVSFLVRLVITVGGIMWVMAGRWERAVACLAGFVLCRQVLIAAWQPRPARELSEKHP